MHSPTTLPRLSLATPLSEARASVSALLHDLQLVAEEINEKPWGLELKFQKTDTRKFVDTFFEADAFPTSALEHPFGPKLLIMKPGTRLSWHYHERKDAFLMSLNTETEVYTNPDNAEVSPRLVAPGRLIEIPHLIRHRLGSGKNWAIIAECSRNAFPDQPSDDSDQVRLSDDFGRV